MSTVNYSSNSVIASDSFVLSADEVHAIEHAMHHYEDPRAASIDRRAAPIFVHPSLVGGAVPTTSGVLLVWAPAGALTLIGALIAAELSSAYPRTGGVYVFL